MSKVKLLIDFGSTFTKVIAIDRDERRIIASEQRVREMKLPASEG